jgi:microcin C transport system permease protein
MLGNSLRAYLLRRLFLIIPTFIGISLLVFSITRFVPGGPIERAIAEARMQQEGRGISRSDSQMQNLSEDQMAQLREYYGFDKPIWQSYLIWLGRVVRFDLGESSRYGEPVWDSIKSRLPVSTYYGILSMLLTYLVCVPLGILKAMKHGSTFDHITSGIIFLGYSIPAYVVGIALIVVFGAQLGWFPLGGFTSEGFDELSSIGKLGDILYHSVLPMTAYVAGSFAVTTLLMKNSLMDYMASDFVRTAIAKGLSYRSAVLKHALRNSLIPLATHFGNNISVIIGGSFLIEKIFNINGFGLLGYDAVVERDYPVVMGILVVSSLLQLFGNILSDICVALVDPRVEFR